MSQLLKMFMIIMLCGAISHAAEPSLVNSSTRAKHAHFKKHRRSSCSTRDSAPPGPTGPQGPQGPIGPTGPQGLSGTNVFAFANFFLPSNTPVDIPFNALQGVGLIPYVQGTTTNILQDPVTSEAIILIPGDYVIDFMMTITNPSVDPTTYTVGIVKRNLFLGQTTFQTVQTYAIKIGELAKGEGGAFSLIGQDMLTLNAGDRITVASLSDPTLPLFGTPPAGAIPATDTPATFTIRLLTGS